MECIDERGGFHVRPRRADKGGRRNVGMSPAPDPPTSPPARAAAAPTRASGVRAGLSGDSVLGTCTTRGRAPLGTLGHAHPEAARIRPNPPESAKICARMGHTVDHTLTIPG